MENLKLNRLAPDGKQLNDKKGKIKSFILDELGYLHIWNETSNQIEIYTWTDLPKPIILASGKEYPRWTKWKILKSIPQ